MTDKERFATTGTWARVLREEGTEINSSTIRNRLSIAGIIGETACNQLHQVVKFGYFAESDVRKYCKDLLLNLPRTDENGLIEIDGEKYGGINDLARLLGISKTVIKSRVRKSTLKPIRGKSRRGKLCDLYSCSGVRGLCEETLQDLPQADESGLIEVGGESYRTIGSFVVPLGISFPSIQSRIEKSFLKPIRGKSKNGSINDFYLVSEVTKLCEDLVQDFPQADENGFLEMGGETYGTVGSLADLLGINSSTVQSKIQKNSLKPIRSKIQNGRPCDLFSLSDVRRICEDLIQDVPQADEKGLFEKDGETYGTVESLSRLLGIEKTSVRSRIQKNSLESVQGKIEHGNIFDFYPISDVRRICEDLIQDLPQADEKGFFEKDGATYGTRGSLARLLGISESSIRLRIQNRISKIFRGRDISGHARDFYLLADVRKLCEDLLQDIPQADKSGLIENNGETYGTIIRLASLLGISGPAIQSRIQRSLLKPIRVKIISGNVCDFYPLTVIRKLCEDLLQDIPHVDERGLFEKDGETYGTVVSLSRMFGFYGQALGLRVKRSALRPIQGKDNGGRVQEFYSSSEVRNLCADLIAKRKKE